MSDTFSGPSDPPETKDWEKIRELKDGLIRAAHGNDDWTIVEAAVSLIAQQAMYLGYEEHAEEFTEMTARALKERIESYASDDCCMYAIALGPNPHGKRPKRFELLTPGFVVCCTTLTQLNAA